MKAETNHMAQSSSPSGFFNSSYYASRLICWAGRWGPVQARMNRRPQPVQHGMGLFREERKRCQDSPKHDPSSEVRVA